MFSLKKKELLRTATLNMCLSSRALLLTYFIHKSPGNLVKRNKSGLVLKTAFISISQIMMKLLVHGSYLEK